MTKLKAALMLVVVVVLGGLIWQEYQTTDSVKASKVLFPDFNPSRIIEIRIRTMTQEILVERSLENYDTWLIKNIQTKNDAITELLSAVAALRAEVIIPSSEVSADGASYGLTPPPLSITLDYGDQSMTLYFGDINPFTKRRYLRVSDRDEMYLVSDIHYLRLKKSRGQLLNNQPLRNESFDGVEEISVVFDGAKIEGIDASPLLNVLKNLKVLSYTDGTESDLKSPHLKILITFAQARSPVIVKIGTKVRSATDEKDESRRDNTDTAPYHAMVTTSRGDTFPVVISERMKDKIESTLKK